MNANPTKLDITKTASMVVAVVAVISLIGGSLFWMGYISSQVVALEEKVLDLEVEIRDTRKELRTEMQILREEIQITRTELLEEIRRSNKQMLEALYNHTHDADGNAVFRKPIIEDP